MSALVHLYSEHDALRIDLDDGAVWIRGRHASVSLTLDARDNVKLRSALALLSSKTDDLPDPIGDIKRALEGREGWHDLSAKVQRKGDTLLIAGLCVTPPAEAQAVEKGRGVSGRDMYDVDDFLARANAMRDQKPAAADEMGELVGLLDEVRSHFTRDDDLPDDLLPRIDAALRWIAGGES